MEQPKIIENHGFEVSIVEPNVVTGVGTPLGTLSTNIELTKSKCSRPVESRTWTVGGLKVGDFLKINCFGLF